MFKTSVNARPYCHLTSFFLENPTQYPDTPYTAETRVPSEDLHRWQYVSLLAFHAIIFRSRTISVSQIGAKTEFNAK